MLAERSQSAESRTSAEKRGSAESGVVLERRNPVTRRALWRLGREKRLSDKSKPSSTRRRGSAE